MSPAYSRADPTDLRRADAENVTQLLVGFSSKKPADLQNLFSRQFCRSASLTMIRATMIDLVSLITSLCFPRKMGRIDAPSITAGMRCLVRCCRGRPMNFFANAPVNKMHFAVYANLTVPSTHQREWPFQASLGLLSKDNFGDELHKLTRGPRSAERVAMSTKALIVGYAKTFAMGSLAAIRDGAYTGISHFDLLVRLAWLGPRGGANTVLRPDYSSIPVSGLPA